MKIKETKVYSFNELSDDAKQVALEKFYDVNIDYGWWESVYDDAKEVGIIIKGFDLGRNNYINGKLEYSLNETANKILKSHGETCDTYKIADKFFSDAKLIENKYPNRETDDKEEYDFDNELDELESEFEESILDAYLVILKDEYEYLTSKEAIIETILANDYEFLESGKLFK